MKTLPALLSALFAISMAYGSQASTVEITSPNKGSTRSDSSIFSRGLHWNERQQRLTAVITYRNTDYTLQADPVETDTFAFALPGVHLDSANNVFYATSRNGQRTPIAAFESGLIGKKIELLPGVVIYAHKNHGNISVELVSGQRSAEHWRETGGEVVFP